MNVWRPLPGHDLGESRNTLTRSTYPACRALLAAKKQRAEIELEMIRAIIDRLNSAHCGRLFEPKRLTKTDKSGNWFVKVLV